MVNWVSNMRFVRASEGKLIPLFVAASTRVSEINDVPCAKDLGVNLEASEAVLGYSHNIVGPPNVSADIKKAWEETLEKVFKDPEWTAQMNKAKYPPSPLMGDKLFSGAKNTLEATGKYKDIIESIGIK
jgi:tripartite-type tricarboxylate transporter receptor subunit TctC